MALDADEFDLIVNTWAQQQADRRSNPRAPRLQTPPTRTSPTTRAAVTRVVEPARGQTWSGSRLTARQRGARRPDGTQVQLLAALRHDTAVVIGQANVENDKTNEILAFAPLITPLNLTGRVVIVDAMHTKKNTARLVVRKGGHYIDGQGESTETVERASRRSERGRPRPPAARELHPWSRPHRPSPGVLSIRRVFDHLPPREDLHHCRARVPLSMTFAPASRPATTSPTSLATTQALRTCSGSCTDIGPSKTSSTGFET